jgi:hypothetical protein
MSSTAMSASNILSIPAEVIEYALTFCPPTAVASFSQTCRLANAIVYESPDQYLWRQLFLLYPFDDPRKSIHGSIIRRVDWRTELQRRIRAKAIAFSPAGRPVQCKIQALQTFITMVHEAAPLSKDQRPLPSDNITWLSRVLDDSHTRILGSHHLPTTPVLARLRSYVTLLTSLSSSAPSVTQAYLQSQRTHSRCMVYDLRNYRAENNWGPYQNDGKKVNWRHMEAIVNVICGNLSELPGPLLYRRLPGGLEATRPYSAPGTLDRDPRDWAGVVGTWRRYVCFMDYRCVCLPSPFC